MSRRDEIAAKLDQRRSVRRSLGLFYLAATPIYLLWRLTTFNDDQLWFSWFFYAAELVSFGLGWFSIYVMLHPQVRPALKAPAGLDVDVMVPVYKEPTDMIRQTMLAAMAIRYPHQTWMLDDGNRPELKALAQELGCKYIARTDNKGAKAGNINNALQYSTAEFVVLFDADHQALPTALDTLLGHLNDPEVAFAQAPQEYYNVDCLLFERLGGGYTIWSEQSVYYDVTQTYRDGLNAAQFVGTCAALRRSAIDAVGGFPEETETEDYHLSLRLHKAGFKSAYVNETVAYGVDAATLGEYHKTRLRWHRGGMHAGRLEKIWWCRGLTLHQRLSYLIQSFTPFDSVQRMLYALTPIISFLIATPPFELTLLNTSIIVSFPIFSILMRRELLFGHGRFLWIEIDAAHRFGLNLRSLVGLFVKSAKWQTSSKVFSGKVEWRYIGLQTVLFLLSAVSLVAAGGVAGYSVLMQITSQNPLPNYQPAFLVLLMGWMLFFCIVYARLIAFLGREREAPKANTYLRELPSLFKVHETGEVLTVSHLSISELRFADAAPTPNALKGELFLPGAVIPLSLARESDGENWEITCLTDWELTFINAANWCRQNLYRLCFHKTPLSLWGKEDWSITRRGTWQPRLDGSEKRLEAYDWASPEDVSIVPQGSILVPSLHLFPNQPTVLYNETAFLKERA